MALYDLHRSTATPLSTRLSAAAVDLVIRLVDARKARATEKSLSRLSDHELSDIGLDRSSLAAFAGRD